MGKKVQFGSGVLYGVPVAGDLAANPTPQKFGVLDNAQVDIKGDTKKLRGQSQFPVAVARGGIDVTVKAKLAVVDAKFLNQLYFGQESTAGITLIADDEAGAIPAAVEYKIAVANHANFVRDYGVIYADTGERMDYVAANPAVGQYTVDVQGNYIFAAADAGKNVKISYTYTVPDRGATVTIKNQLQGYAPEFRALLYNGFRGKYFALELFDCVASEISLPTKQGDFWVADFNFEAFTDDSDTLGKIYAD